MAAQSQAERRIVEADLLAFGRLGQQQALLIDGRVAQQRGHAVQGRCIPDLLARGAHCLPISLSHALAVRTLPPHHADPFDRMLIAQAHCEDLTLVTADALIRAYDIRTLDATS